MAGGGDAYVVRQDMRGHPAFRGGHAPLGRFDVELTERCNNACIHCCINLPADDAAAMSRELSTGEWKGILRQAADLGAMGVRFTGGEPLLRRDFAELYLYARRLGLRVQLFTNGRLITPELADLWVRVPPGKAIEISVYGMSAVSYEAVTCRKSAYEEFCRGVGLLRERKVPFILKGALLPQNKGDMVAFEKWAREVAGMNEPPSCSMFFDLRCRRDSPAKNRLIESLRMAPEEGVEMLARDKEQYRDGMREFCGRFMGAHGDRLFYCGAGHGGCVDAYGMFQVCMGVRAPELAYDLRKGSLKDALARVFPAIREMRTDNPAYLTRCGHCFLGGLCEQCPGKSWSEHGTLDTPVEYLCQVAHAQARHLGLLARDEHAWDVTDGRQRVEKLCR